MVNRKSKNTDFTNISRTSIKNVDINKIVVTSKMFLNISLATKMLKIYLYASIFQKWVHIEETLIKLNVCLFSIKDNDLLEKYNEIWEKVKNSIKK